MSSNSKESKQVQNINTITKNVFKTCQKEAELNAVLLPLNDCEGRTVQYTNLPRSYVHYLLKEVINYETDSQPFDVFERMLVMKSLLKCYTIKVTPFPTYKDIYDMVKESVKVKDVGHLRYQMNKMGFDYRKTTTGQILVEDMKLTFERFNYLKKIRKCKADKTLIYYLDERVLDETLKFPKPNFGKTGDKEDDLHLHDGYFFYHVLSDAGLGRYVFTNKKSKDTYIKWVFDVLLKALKPGSLIVIDDHPIHGKLTDETITRYHSRADMVNWLKKKNIPYSISMQKAELYELISRSAKQNIDFNFDRLLKSHGYDVLRLPYGCRNLSPSALFWKEFSAIISRQITDFTPIGLEAKVLGAITSFHSSTWKKLGSRVTYWEEQFLDIDSKTEAVLDQICKFDVEHIEKNEIQEYFYDLENL